MPTQNGAVDKRRSIPPKGGGCHFGPISDPTDVTGIAQGDGCEPSRLAFVDADLDGLRRHGLAVAEAAIHHRKCDRDLHGPVGNRTAGILAPDIDRNPDYAMAIVTCEVSACEVRRDTTSFFGGRPGEFEYFGNEANQILNI
jgi:hypothetical protein